MTRMDIHIFIAIGGFFLAAAISEINLSVASR